MSASPDIVILQEKLAAFFLSAEFTIEAIPGGASSRKYFKIRFGGKSYFPPPTALLMQIPLPEISLLSDYMNIGYYFQRMGIPTPRLLEINREEGWIFLEYQELPTLETYFRTHPGKVEKVLPQLIDFLFDMQKKCLVEERCPAFRRRFDYEKYMYEFDFHLREQLLKFYFRRECDPGIMQNFAREISSTLDISLPVFVHRDFQSSNIFYDENDAENRFKLIDFQDARHGTPVYDLVSCLWDSYIPVADDLRNDLLREYFSRLPELGVEWNWEEYEKFVDFTVIQRKLHDAGAFAYNYRRFNSAKYVGYIKDAIGMALKPLRKYQEFWEVAQFFIEILSADSANSAVEKN